MESGSDIKKLKELAKELSLLYVDDNKGLQKQAFKVLKNFFKNVTVATNGQEGVLLFKKNLPDIVITDIKMPGIDGLEMSKKIKEIDPHAHIIIASAFDEKEYLLESIALGISRYLKKPIEVNILIETLISVIEQINNEKNIKLFEQYSSDIFEYQDLILVLLENDKAVTINKKCMEFFDVESIDEFRGVFKHFDNLFLPQENFLYKKDDINWLELIKANSGKLYNVKLKDKSGGFRHFLLKASKIPKKENYYILSFDDITELGLLDEDENSENPKKENEKEKILNIFKVLQRNNSKVRLYNYYKGLSITNEGSIEEILDDQITIKTTYLQQRAIHINKTTTIESELFGEKALECKMSSINFQTQCVVFEDCRFVPYMPSKQRYVRVMPESNTKVELRFKGLSLDMQVRIIDISLEGCNLSLKSLPAGLKQKSTLLLNIELFEGKNEVKLHNIKSEVLKISEEKDEFRVVVGFVLQSELKKQLTNYIAKRQMALIREFKGLEYAK